MYTPIGYRSTLESLEVEPKRWEAVTRETRGGPVVLRRFYEAVLVQRDSLRVRWVSARASKKPIARQTVGPVTRTSPCSSA